MSDKQDAAAIEAARLALQRVLLRDYTMNTAIGQIELHVLRKAILAGIRAYEATVFEEVTRRHR